MGKKWQVAEAKTETYEWAVSVRPQDERRKRRRFLVSFRATPKRRAFYGCSIGLSSGDRSAIVSALKAGLPFSSFERLQSQLGVPANVLAGTISVAARTLSRRKREGRFKTDESERLFRVARLFDRALEVLEGAERAARWLKTPKKALGGVAPLEYAVTEPGAQEVFDLLGRLEQGVLA